MRQILVYVCIICCVSCRAEETSSPMPEVSEVERLGEQLRIVHSVDDAALLGVWGHKDRAWIVGGSTTPESGLILHFDGTSFVEETSPKGPLLWWIFGADSQNIWAVGERGRILRRTSAGWQTEFVFEDDKAVLYGIWGSSPTDLWAVGGSVRRNGPKGLVLRSTGDGVWRRIEDASFPTDLNFYKVWGRNANDVMIVGEDGLTIHWNGRSFTRQNLGIRDILFTVHTAPDRPWCVVGGTNRGLAFTGNDPMVQPLPSEGLPALNGVTVHGEDDILAVGGRGIRYLWNEQNEGQRIDVSERRGIGGRTLHSVWSGQDVWVVGGDLTALTKGIVLRARQGSDEEKHDVSP